MVDISFDGSSLVIEPRGLHKLWAMRMRIVVPLSAVRSVRRAPPDIGTGLFKGWRLPGTHVPGLITAGSYLHDGHWTFWDVSGSGKNAIEVELTGTRYSRLVMDVADPDATVRRLHGTIAHRSR